VKDKIKTNSSDFITTSGDSVNVNTYGAAETYVSVKSNSMNETIIHQSGRYVRTGNKTKAYSASTKKHHELLVINEKLKKLG